MLLALFFLTGVAYMVNFFSKHYENQTVTVQRVTDYSGKASYVLMGLLILMFMCSNGLL